MKHLLVVGLLVGALLLPSRPAWAQLPVIDSLNLAENTAMTIQSVIQTVQQVAMVLSWGIDLAQIGSSATNGEEFEGDLGAIVGLAGEVGALSYDLQDLQRQTAALFSLETAPHSSTGMATRAREVRQILVRAHSYALRTQTLLKTVQRTIQHILNITNRIGELFGNVSSQQNGQEYLAKLTQLETQAAVQATAMQRAQSIKEVNDPVEMQAIDNIKASVRSDMPVRTW